jgi:molecular chaperone GrpE
VGPEAAGIPLESALVAEQPTGKTALPVGVTEAPVPALHEADEAHDGRPEAATAGTAGHSEELVAEIFAAVRGLAASSERYHARAEQREGVIDHLRTEVDKVRRGERRGLLRPLLVEVCRLRNDLLRQADELPDNFDAERARLLLRSYAESVEFALETSGVIAFAPEEGDPFEPRMHRLVGGEPASDPMLAGRVARVRRAGYLDVDANSPIAPAEVVLLGPVSAASAETPVFSPDEQPGPATVDPCGPPDDHLYGSPDSHDDVSATDDRSEP